MDHWEESPLNKAHFYERKAKGFGKKLMYDEAINCHSSALAEYGKALQYTDNSKAIQSIKLQIEYSERQIDYLKWKKLQHQAYMRAVKLQKEAMCKIMRASSIRESECGKDDKRTTLSTAFYRTIAESDSLLELLAQGGKENEEDKENKSNEGEPGASKSSKTLNKVTDLQLINSTLRSLTAELMCEIMLKEREVAALEKKIIKMEAKTIAKKSKARNARVRSSRAAISSVDEIVRAASAQLPNLPPLELPVFDYSMFHSQENEFRG